MNAVSRQVSFFGAVNNTCARVTLGMRHDVDRFTIRTPQRTIQCNEWRGGQLPVEQQLLICGRRRLNSYDPFTLCPGYGADAPVTQVRAAVKKVGSREDA